MAQQHQRLGCIILAGGQGSRLRPLTSHCAKPAVAFAGHYRVIDFVLSNCINSGCDELWVLGQYQVDGLHHYLHQQWSKHRCPADIHIVKTRESKLKGTAGAVFQQLQQFEHSQATHLLVLSADHVYKMDFRQMLDFHLEREACMTIAAMPVPAELAPQFGVIAMDSQQRVTGFYEKPKPHQIRHLIDNNGMVLVSMGNYLFNRYCLFQSLQQDSKKILSRHDFGHDIIPAMYPKEPVYVYDFSSNLVPGESQHYWRDVGTQDAFFQAHMDLLGPNPAVRLHNEHWPLFGKEPMPPSYFAGSDKSSIQDSLIGAGCELSAASIRHSVIGSHCRIHQGAELEDCVLMGQVEVGANSKLRNVIVTENCRIAGHSSIGFNPRFDSQHYQRLPSGLVVVSSGQAGISALNDLH
ncbi:sugar phosphate nucleotidyltransferase [Alkalimonas amylolytica]|uniref:Glucose-1-phosphate adenylyltransferase n=1 Tax=Alkalimonas amylolytica TaxID=152573 RepID=A0A1H4CGM7_ALKAM|nr:sugar phosphate nucleotidyltransferase [Alkalimonas amylolytica]SEA59469.1 glucose-1-phosphate adenylyltransferase [Alkalimonas amylolytica]